VKQVYNKYNSFLGLRLKEKYNANDFLNNLKLILSDKKNLVNLNQYNTKILDYIKKDLFAFGTKGKLKFGLSPNVVKEIQSINVNEIPKYLIHRYRYEIYPQLRISDDFPPYLQIEPTSICNYRCVFCYQTDNKFNKRSTGYMGHMKLAIFKLLIDQAEGNIEFISLASRGEPLLCPDFKKMLAYTRDKFFNLKINTNASLLDEKMSYAILESGVKTLVFSVDAADSALYSKLRVNGKLEKIVTNIKKFQEIRTKNYSNSKIITRVSGVKVNNQQDLGDMESYWGDIVDQVAFVDYMPWENVYQSDYSGIQTSCSDLWRRMFVWWDGKINPCDIDYKSKLSIGNIKNNNISELWKSDQYNILRHQHESKLRSKTIPCNRCVLI
jgi:radical SAM protein with 4Fe4S-binding SPASM domain|tara:strand:- start:616 stop:1764 length:1149 start_codon:yes stop_codon:yes gene_type:complete